MTDGSENTKIIIKKCGIESAAGACVGLSIDGYTDWYLPAIKELSLMYKQFMAIGGFAMADYWSSTEEVTNGGPGAWAVRFAKAGKECIANKNKNFCVRPIRKF